MNLNYSWNPKLNEHQIEFRVLDVDDDGEILRRTDTIIGWVQYYGGNRHVLVRATLPDDTCDFDSYDVRTDPYASKMVPKYYRPIVSGDLILYDGLSLLFKMRDIDMGYGMVNLSNVFSHALVNQLVEIFQIVKTVDFTREYTHDEVLHEIDRYMML